MALVASTLPRDRNDLTARCRQLLGDLRRLRHLQTTTDMTPGIPVAASSDITRMDSTVDVVVLRGLKLVTAQLPDLILVLRSRLMQARFPLHQDRSLNEAIAPCRERGAMGTQMPTTINSDSTTITRNANDVRRLMPHMGEFF